ncbi:acyl-CoA thioesterase [Ideonella paludis]|uniref:Acyl-CoA thioesterase n=1 Tax=Ideonella paludis TaxID=1233411 RepID=A0ABS5DS70_9BURK|nr:acyl-CoA thioesterase [Ideonella paludis]MBQ0933972.1 acyl-CoA thioesterase [Ideonella paludis]
MSQTRWPLPVSSELSARLTHDIEVTPAFFDIDPMEVVWHGHYVKFMELARSALMSRLGYNYAEMRDSGFAWPVVDMRLKYVRSAVLGQRLKVRARIVEWENRLKVDFLITDAQTGQRLTTAYTIQVAVDIASREMRFLCPEILWEKLGVLA